MYDELKRLFAAVIENGRSGDTLLGLDDDTLATFIADYIQPDLPGYPEYIAAFEGDGVVTPEVEAEIVLPFVKLGYDTYRTVEREFLLQLLAK